MIREGTGKEITRENRRNPHIRNTTEINTGGTGAVPPGPRKARRRRMEIPPNVNSATGIEKVPERRKTLTRRVRWVRTETVNRPIKNRVEIATKDGRNRRIHLHMKIIEKLVPCRVAIRRINTTHTKRFTTKHEFTLEITANAITPRIDQRQRRPKKNNTATRMYRATRKGTTKTGRLKPQRTLRQGQAMCLLKADNVYTYREGAQPLHETSTLGLIPDSVAVQRENRQRHEKEKTGHNHFFTTDEGPREIAAIAASAVPPGRWEPEGPGTFRAALLPVLEA